MAVAKGPGPAKGPKVDLDDLVRRWEADKKSRLFLQLADEYRRQDQLDAAISVLKEGLKVHATFVPAHVALARCLMAKGQPAQAQAELEPIHKKSPDNMLAGKLLAEVLTERGERQRALSVLQSLKTFAMDDPEVDERIAALEAQLHTPITRTSGPGETGEFATGEFAGTTGGLGGVAPSAAGAWPPLPASRVIPSPGSTTLSEAAAVLGLAAAMPTENVAEDAADDICVIDASEDGVVADEPAASLSAATAEHDGVLEDVVLSPIPRPAEGAEDLLGAPHLPPAPDDADEFTSMTLAELHESQGDTAHALSLYERLLARRPGDDALRSAVERCRARLAGASAATVIEAVAAAPPSVARPRWEPIRARSLPSAPADAPPRPSPDSGAPPVAEAAQGPLATPPGPEPAPRPPRAPAPRGGGGTGSRETVRELRRWLAAVAAVRQ